MQVMLVIILQDNAYAGNFSDHVKQKSVGGTIW